MIYTSFKKGSSTTIAYKYWTVFGFIFEFHIFFWWIRHILTKLVVMSLSASDLLSIDFVVFFSSVTYILFVIFIVFFPFDTYLLCVVFVVFLFSFLDFFSIIFIKSFLLLSVIKDTMILIESNHQSQILSNTYLIRRKKFSLKIC